MPVDGAGVPWWWLTQVDDEVGVSPQMIVWRQAIAQSCSLFQLIYVSSLTMAVTENRKEMIR